MADITKTLGQESGMIFFEKKVARIVDPFENVSHDPVDLKKTSERLHRRIEPVKEIPIFDEGALKKLSKYPRIEIFESFLKKLSHNFYGSKHYENEGNALNIYPSTLEQEHFGCRQEHAYNNLPEDFFPAYLSNQQVLASMEEKKIEPVTIYSIDKNAKNQLPLFNIIYLHYCLKNHISSKTSIPRR